MLRRAALLLVTLVLASSAPAVTLTEWGMGASAWTADFSLTGSLPVVRAEAFSSGVSFSADAFAVEGFTYNGGRSGSVTLSIQLDDPAPVDLGASLFAQIYVLEEPAFDLMAPAASRPSVSQD
jgi:hypothetical protein